MFMRDENQGDFGNILQLHRIGDETIILAEGLAMRARVDEHIPLRKL
jgi:hypothetical protein